MLITGRECALGGIDPEIPVLRVEDTRAFLLRLGGEYRRILQITRVISVTGSAGKTTTKHLIHHILNGRLRGACAPKSFNNDIGLPLTLFSARPEDDYVVLEIGTNAPGEIGHLASIARPDIAVITSIGRAHVERLGTIEQIAREKASILGHVTPAGLAVVNADHPELTRELTEFVDRDMRLVRFGESADADMRLTDRGCREGAFWLEIIDAGRFSLRLPGLHNALNAMAAIAVAREMGLDDDQIRQGLASAQPPPMRMTRSIIGGVEFFNDAYNANPDSMIASLRAFAEMSEFAHRRVVILGDMLELGNQAPALHRELGRFLRRLCRDTSIDLIVFVGGHGDDIARGFAAQAQGTHLICVESLDAAMMREILNLLVAGDSVLVKGSRRMQLERLIDAAVAREREPIPAAGAGASAQSHLA